MLTQRRGETAAQGNGDSAVGGEGRAPFHTAKRKPGGPRAAKSKRGQNAILGGIRGELRRGSHTRAAWRAYSALWPAGGGAGRAESRRGPAGLLTAGHTRDQASAAQARRPQAAAGHPHGPSVLPVPTRPRSCPRHFSRPPGHNQGGVRRLQEEGLHCRVVRGPLRWFLADSQAELTDYATGLGAQLHVAGPGGPYLCASPVAAASEPLEGPPWIVGGLRTPGEDSRGEVLPG